MKSFDEATNLAENVDRMLHLRVLYLLVLLLDIACGEPLHYSTVVSLNHIL